MSWSFKPGDRVVCIDAETDFRPAFEKKLSKGAVYTVRETLLGFAGIPALRLVELVNPVKRYSNGVEEAAYRAARFRPVRTTSIESLRAHLSTIPANRSVDA